MNYGLKNKIDRDVGEYIGLYADAFETFRLIYVAISELFDEAAKISLEFNKRWYESPRNARIQLYDAMLKLNVPEDVCAKVNAAIIDWSNDAELNDKQNGIGKNLV